MTQNKHLRSLASVNAVLDLPAVVELAAQNGRPVVTYAVRTVIERARAHLLKGDPACDIQTIVSDVVDLVGIVCDKSLKPIVNTTGVVLHTNLGRAPLGQAVIDEIARTVVGYSNLEFDLARGRRGDRSAHVRELLRFLTGAEDALVVNNNAAGIMLALNTLANGREVIVSRGELIEIGGAFRMPEIMAASGARMVEVGTTNRTRVSDYEEAIGPETALLFKAHKSNYTMSGFTEEAPVKELAQLAHARGLPMMFDIGSGLLRKPKGVSLPGEPDVPSALSDGADVVAFSCDKLLGGPQGGVLAGSSTLISCMASAPLMRALRVGKLTVAALSAACRAYLTDEGLLASNPTFVLLNRSGAELKRLAAKLVAQLKRLKVDARTTKSAGQCGGGSLPGQLISSVAVEVLPLQGTTESKQTFAEHMFQELLQRERPVLGILRKGKILFDVLTVFEDDIPYVAKAISESIPAGKRR